MAWLILGLASHVVIKRIKERRAKDKREGENRKEKNEKGDEEVSRRGSALPG